MEKKTKTNMTHPPDEEKTSSSQSKERVPSTEIGRTTQGKRKASSENGGANKKTRLREASEPAEPSSQEHAGVQVMNKTKSFLGKLRRTFLHRTKDSKTSLVKTGKEQFETKYEQMELLGDGGFGCVFSGFRKSDNLQVAIIPKWNAPDKMRGEDRQLLYKEVGIMLKLKAVDGQSVGKASPVVLLDWYDLQEEVVLVMERPIPATDLLVYLKDKGGKAEEDEVKITMKQLIQTAVDLEERPIFHDFGQSCVTREHSIYTVFKGTLSNGSPESLFGSSYRAGPTTVWQLGMVGYEALHVGKFITQKFMTKNLKISKDLSKDCQNILQNISPVIRP